MMIRVEAWRLVYRMRRLGIDRLESVGFTFPLFGRVAVELNGEPIWLPFLCRWWLRRAVKAQGLVDAWSSMETMR